MLAVALLLVGRSLQSRPSDFDQVWFGARAIWSGQNPYELIGPGRALQWDWPLYYPATALILVSPLALLPLVLARAVFVGASTALLAYGVTRESWFRLTLFCSGAYGIAAMAAQWSPLLTAAICLPALAFVVPAKPNIGTAIIASNPTRATLRSATLGAIVLVAVSLILMPSWPMRWLATVRSGSGFLAPIGYRGGVLLLLGLLRWRRPEARLLIALAILPHNLVIYATLPLFVIPRTFGEMLAMTALNTLALICITLVVQLHAPSFVDNRYMAGDVLVALCYLPALFMVLMRPNEGALPAWIERRVPWLRARSGSESLDIG
ncbi:MAG: hypothetical protein ACREOJ_11815 [Gemmatimonadaceae bacterium]